MHSNADTLLAQHPDIETVEALITDCNGAARGKWLPIEKLPAPPHRRHQTPQVSRGTGRLGPRRAADRTRQRGSRWLVSGGAGLAGPGFDGHRYRSRAGRTDHVQGRRRTLLSDPRQVLAQVVDKLEKKGFVPRVAIELEFNLFRRPDDNQTLRDACLPRMKPAAICMDLARWMNMRRCLKR